MTADRVKTYQRLIQRLERDKASPDIISACKERLAEAYSNEIGTTLRKSNKLPSLVMFTNSSWVVSSFLQLRH